MVYVVPLLHLYSLLKIPTLKTRLEMKCLRVYTDMSFFFQLSTAGFNTVPLSWADLGFNTAPLSWANLGFNTAPLSWADLGDEIETRFSALQLQG